MPVDPTSYDDVVKAIEKQYGNKVISTGADYDNPARISTGSPSLDWAMGGGIPIGRRSRFYGRRSSGKTRTVWNIIRSAQSMGMTCVYYNIEKQYHKEFVQSLGIDVDELKVVNKTRIEEIGAICESLLGVAHVHVFDSASAAAAIDALNADVEDWHRALKARTWNKVFDRLLDKFDDSENTLIYIDQARINQRFGYIYPPGGEAMEHASDMTLEFKKGKWLYRDKHGYLNQARSESMHASDMSGEYEPDGVETLVRVVKSRVGRPERTAMLQYDFLKNEFDVTFEYARAALDLGLAKKTDQTWISMNGDRFQGMAKFRQHIDGDTKLQLKLHQALMKKAS